MNMYLSDLPNRYCPIDTFISINWTITLGINDITLGINDNITITLGIDIYIRGKKITCPGALDKLNFRQDKHIFSPNVLRTSKKFTDSLFFLEKDK